MIWEDLISAYLDTRRSQVAPATLEKSGRELRDWLEFCQLHQLAAPAATTPRHLDVFVRYLQHRPCRRSRDGGRPISQRSIAHKLTVVRHFLRWATEKRHLLLDPAAHVTLPCPDRPPLVVLTVSEVEALLAAPDSSHPLGLRDQAILETLYGTGIRAAECHRLDLDDVDLRRAQLRIRQGKGARDRLVPIGDHLAEALTRYLEESRPALRPQLGESALFVTAQNRRRLGLVRLKYLPRFYARQVGLTRPVGPHALRHAFALHLLEGGARLHSVKAMLGHRVIKSTEFYTELLPLSLIREHRRTHPRSRRRSRRPERRTPR